MALVSLNLRPSEKQVRDFAVIAFGMCIIIGLLLFLLGKIQAGGLGLFCAVGLIIYVLSRISTALVKPLYQGMMIAAFPIGWVVSHVMMGLFYFVILTSVALLFKLLKRDPLCRKWDSGAKTYWIPYQSKHSIRDYFNQF